MIVMSNNPMLPDLLGKHIKVLPNYNLSCKLENVNIYESNFEGIFLDKSFNKLGVISNKQDTIIEVSIYFSEVIDRPFYELLLKNYNLPNNILKPDKIISSEEWENDEFKSTKVVSKLIETSFEDNPVLIRWCKKDFLIEIKPNYGNKMTRIIFKKTQT